jgi:hypothetical protein
LNHPRSKRSIAATRDDEKWDYAIDIKNRSVGWDHGAVLSFFLLLNPLEPVAATTASATLGVLQRLQIPNLDAFCFFLLFHFRRSFLVCSTHYDRLAISICANDVSKASIESAQPA